ncbi:MAG: ATP-dependent DNA helicase RecG [Methylotenera sp.]|nr:ATP-dependent DNA helicase RecG [Oligoflexia bacterium]
MPPKVKSSTTSSPSATSETPVQFVKGVGPRLGAVFTSRGIVTVKDLLTFFPRSYEDRTRLLKVSELSDGEKSTVAVRVTNSKKIPLKMGRSILDVSTADESGTLGLKWFHAPRGMESRFTPGTQIIVTGTVKMFMSRPQMVHPEIAWGLSSQVVEEKGQPNVGRVVPVYTELEGIPSRSFRKILWEALEKFSETLTEDLPIRYREAHQLPKLGEAVKAIHFPDTEEGVDAGTSKAANAQAIQDLVDFNTPAHARLIYEEFFKFEYLILRQRLHMEQEHAPAFGTSGGKKAMQDLTGLLPFKLTGDQQKAIDEIATDLSQTHPMNRLIQGDVGSGKTAVAFLTAGLVLAEGGQAALMAPTEILAEQHYRNAVKLFGGRLAVHMLVGKTPQSERIQLQAKLASGMPLLLIGTHALIEDPVVFKNLVFVMIDEQHRFGVEQRRTLRRKGMRADAQTGKLLQPHSLILTATPIPRTLALTAYGDLGVSTIREMPPGRIPIISKVIQGNARIRAYETIRGELIKGHQAYFIYPLVNDSEAEGFTSLKSAVAEAETLQQEVFPEFKVGLLHGQMKSDEKSAVMDRFKRNELQVLVSTTVVEVGVDVPNATIMVIEHSERFGLSQLHQLRGRVGRGSAQSYCFFFASAKVAEMTSLRLDVLEETNDGFKIAEADLRIRGPGEFLGTRQAGGLPFKLADIVRDRDWLLKAREDAQELLKTDPNLEQSENLPLRRYYEREGKLQFERLKTS